MVRVVLDVDTGVDDALALVLAARSPAVDLAGVGTVAGNVDVDRATRNTLRALEVAGASDVPVAAGADRPLIEPFRDATAVHGSDGLGDSDQPAPVGRPSGEHAVDQLLRLSHEHRGELVVVAVGPLTNLGLALARDPTLADRLAQVVVMAGSAQVGGNREPWAEANVATDPEAADIVFRAPVERVMVGLDVTMQVLIEERHLAILDGSSDPAASFASAIVPHYCAAYERWLGRRSFPAHDATAVAAVIDPSVLTTHDLPVAVETTGTHTRGMTVVDQRPLRRARTTSGSATSRVALDVDADAARRLLLDSLTHQHGAAATE